VMIGGATDPGAVDVADAELVSIVRTDLERTMGLRIEPELVHLIRHWRGIPQYTIGHQTRLERIEAALAPHRGLFLAGNSYRGVSINACIEDAARVAGRIADHLRTLEGRAGYDAARRRRTGAFPPRPAVGRGLAAFFRWHLACVIGAA